MKPYTGSCHCGAVRFAFEMPEITDGMRCDCSICIRKGSLLTTETVPPDRMQIDAEDGALMTYAFGTMTARHHFCGTCGIHTFVETRLRPGEFRVNLGCVEGLDSLQLPTIFYDGKNL